MKNKTIITAIITLILLQFFVLISCTQQQNKDDKPDTTRVAKEISLDTNSPEKNGANNSANSSEIISDDAFNDNSENKKKHKIKKISKKNKGIKHYANLYENIFLQYLKEKEGAGEKIIKIIDEKNGFANFIVEDKIYTRQPSSQKASLAIWLNSDKKEIFGVFTYENDGNNEYGEIKNLKFYKTNTSNVLEEITTQIVPITAIEALFKKRKPQETTENKYFNPYLMVVIPQKGTTITLTQQTNADNPPQIIGELVFDKKITKFDLIEK